MKQRNPLPKALKSTLLATTALLAGGAALPSVQQAHATELPQILIIEDGESVTNDLDLLTFSSQLPQVLVLGHNATFTNNGDIISDLTNADPFFAPAVAFDEIVGGTFINNGVVSVGSNLFSGGFGDGVFFQGAEFELPFDPTPEDIFITELAVDALLSGNGLPQHVLENNGVITANFSGVFFEDVIGDVLITNNAGAEITGDVEGIGVNSQFGSTSIFNAGLITGTNGIEINSESSLEVEESDLIEAAVNGDFADAGLTLAALQEIGLFGDKEINVTNASGGEIVASGGSAIDVEIAIDIEELFDETPSVILDLLGDDLPRVDVNIVNEEGATISATNGIFGFAESGISVGIEQLFETPETNEALEGLASVTIDNAGLISVTGEETTGIFIDALPNIDITNSGEISVDGANSTAININSSQSSVAIDNSGLISASGGLTGGVEIANASDVSLDNTGDIEGALFGLLVDGADSFNAVNGGTITGVNENVLLFAVNALDVDEFDFANSGRIEAAVIGISHFNDSLTGNSVISNSGIITNGTVGLLDFGIDASQLDSAEISNSGEINSQITGISFFTVGTASVNNSGEITVGLARDTKTFDLLEVGVLFEDVQEAALVNSGLIQTAQDFRVGVLSAGGTSFTLDNSGEIISDSFAVQLLGVEQSTLSNSGLLQGGTIAVTSDSGSVMLTNDGTVDGHVVLADADDVVENFGTIDGNVLLGGGSDVFTAGSNSTVTGIVDGGADEDALQVSIAEGEEFLVDDAFLANFENFESFEKVGDGEISFMATSSVGPLEANDGILSVNSTFTGDVNVGLDGRLGGSGTIIGDVFVEGILNPGNSPGTLMVDGDVTFGADTSAFEVEFSVDTADLLLVTGVVTIEDGSTLILTPEGDDVFGIFTHEVLNAEGGIFGEFETITAPNFVLSDLRYEGNSLFIDFITQLGADVALNAQSSIVADYLNGRLVAGANDATLDVFSSLVSLPTTQLNSALGDLHPESYAASSSLSATSSLGVVDALRDQLVVGRDAEKGHIDLWVSGLADFGDQDGQGATSGFDTDSYGVVAGLSYGVTDAITVGALVGYQNIEQDFDGIRAESDADNVFFGAYASAGFNKFNVDAAFIYHTAEVDTTRSITVLNDTAFGDYDVDALTLSGRIGYEAYAKDGWLIEPYAGLTYINSDRDDVTEVGADGANLFVAGEETDFTFLDLGTRVVGQWADGKIAPYVDLAWRYDLSNDGNGATARFINESASFRVSGADVERSRAHVGAGLTGHITDKLKAYVSYGGDFGSDLTNHALRTGVRYSF